MQLLQINWHKLFEIEEKLRVYAHGDCKDVYACPEDHGHVLSLDQSFAWTIADRLLGIIEKRNIEGMTNFLRETLMYYVTLRRYQQSSKYPELIQLIKGIHRACHDKED